MTAESVTFFFLVILGLDGVIVGVVLRAEARVRGVGAIAVGGGITARLRELEPAAVGVAGIAVRLRVMGATVGIGGTAARLRVGATAATGEGER